MSHQRKVMWTYARQWEFNQRDFAINHFGSLLGGAYTLIKIAVETIPPITAMAIRTLIACIILLTILKARGVSFPKGSKIWRQFSLQSLLNCSVPFTLIAWGEQSVSATQGTIINSSVPIFTFLLVSFLGISSERSALKIVGVSIGLIGIILVVGIEELFSEDAELLGFLAIVIATILYSFAAIYGKNFAKYDPMIPATGSLLIGTSFLVPLSLFVDEPWNLHMSIMSLGAVFLLGIFSTAFAFIIYFRLLKTLGPVGTTSQAYLRVPIGVFLGVIILGETISSTGLVGATLVVLSVIAMTYPARQLKLRHRPNLRN